MSQALDSLSTAQLIKMRDEIDALLRPERVRRVFSHVAKLRKDKVALSARVQNLCVSLDGIWSLSSILKGLSLNDQLRLDDILDELEAILGIEE